MGRIVHLTEEQIKEFFGEGFSAVMLGENRAPAYDKMREKEPVLNSPKAMSASKKYKDITGRPEGNDDNSLYYNGLRYVSREGKDLPGYGGAVAKMADFGSSNLTSENAVNNNELLSAIMEIRGNSPLNLLDVLEILHQLKNKKMEMGDAGQEAFNFLNSINIDYILSNFITVNAPDYVFWRLKNLTPQEIENIKKTYKRDFSEFGQRCDGCGIKEWKSTVTPFEHDDAHINLEYMGSEASSINESLGGPRKFNVFPVPFQIHHMNENAGDNSPLNLSCLCPNCHAITGSYGKPKNAIESEDMKILTQLEDLLGGESGATGSLSETLMSPEERKDIVDALKRGEFERKNTVNSQMGVTMSGNLELDPEDPELLSRVSQFGVENPEEFIREFNRMFVGLWDDGYEEFIGHHKLNEDISPDSAGEEDDEIESVSSSSGNTLDGIEFTYKISCSKGGDVTATIFAGDAPFLFDAFKNKAVPLTPMYFEDGENREKAKIEVRNAVLGVVLNSIKAYRKGKISNWEAPVWTMKNKGVAVDKIRKIKPFGKPRLEVDAQGKPTGGIVADPTGLMDAKSLFNTPETGDYSAGKERSVSSAQQTRTRGNYNENDFWAINNILTGPEEVAMNVLNNNSRFGAELKNFLIDKRKEGYGSVIPQKPKKAMMDAIKQMLIDAGFYEYKPGNIK